MHDRCRGCLWPDGAALVQELWGSILERSHDGGSGADKWVRHLWAEPVQRDRLSSLCRLFGEVMSPDPLLILWRKRCWRQRRRGHPEAASLYGGGRGVRDCS